MCSSDLGAFSSVFAMASSFMKLPFSIAILASPIVDKHFSIDVFYQDGRANATEVTNGVQKYYNNSQWWIFVVKNVSILEYSLVLWRSYNWFMSEGINMLRFETQTRRRGVSRGFRYHGGSSFAR